MRTAVPSGFSLGPWLSEVADVQGCQRFSFPVQWLKPPRVPWGDECREDCGWPEEKKVLSQLLLQRLCFRWNGINTGTSTGFGGNMDYRCRALARRRSELQQPQESDVPLCGMSLFGGRPSSCKVPCTLQSGVWCTLLISSGVHQASPGERDTLPFAC